MSPGRLEQLQAEVDYYRDRAAPLRAKLYRWGLGTNAHLQELERKLKLAEQRLQEVRGHRGSQRGPARFT